MSADKSDGPLNVEGAMKILNMKKLDASELNDRFKFRVLSVSQGLGGSLKKQKSVYSAWEYLNRTLAKESSSHVEDILKKVNKTGIALTKTKKVPLTAGKSEQQNKIPSTMSNKQTLIKNKTASTNKLSPENKGKPSNSKKLGAIKGGVSLHMVAKKRLESGQKLVVTSENGAKQGSKDKSQLKINCPATKGIKSEANVGQLNKIIATSKSSFNPSINSDQSKTTGVEEMKICKIPSGKYKRGFKQSKVSSSDLVEETLKSTRPDKKAQERRDIWKKTANIFVKPELAKKAVATIKKKSKDVKKPPKEQQVLYKTPNVDVSFEAASEAKRFDSEETGGFYTNSRINNWILSGKYGIK